MSKEVTIIDYGIGNIQSVLHAIEHCDAKAILSNDPKAIARAERVVLPGVGAFKKGMDELRQRNLIDPIKEFAAKNRPLLGICLGMQMMLEKSSEFGDHSGLGLIEGSVEAIPGTTSQGKPHKIPHIGWAPITVPENTDWNQSILKGIQPESAFYFVHSYTAHPKNHENRLADCHYNGRLVAAAIRRENLYGCQFHPERSGEWGLKIIKNFIEL